MRMALMSSLLAFRRVGLCVYAAHYLAVVRLSGKSHYHSNTKQWVPFKRLGSSFSLTSLSFILSQAILPISSTIVRWETERMAHFFISFQQRSYFPQSANVSGLLKKRNFVTVATVGHLFPLEHLWDFLPKNIWTIRYSFIFSWRIIIVDAALHWLKSCLLKMMAGYTQWGIISVLEINWILDFSF